MKKYAVNVHYDAVISVEVIAENEEQALELAKQKGESIPLNEADVAGVNACITDEQELTPIMDTSNNHNEVLVAKINKAYHTKRRDFDSIVSLLMIRDKDECDENNVNNDTYSYLMHVADDTDLESIINFTRVD